MWEVVEGRMHPEGTRCVLCTFLVDILCTPVINLIIVVMRLEFQSNHGKIKHVLLDTTAIWIRDARYQRAGSFPIQIVLYVLKQ